MHLCVILLFAEFNNMHPYSTLNSQISANELSQLMSQQFQLSTKILKFKPQGQTQKMT